MNTIKFTGRPEGTTHVNPKNRRSYRVVDGVVAVNLKGEWVTSQVSVDQLIPMPSAEPQVDPVEERLKELVGQSITITGDATPAAVAAQLAAMIGCDPSQIKLIEVTEEEEEECGCPDCLIERHEAACLALLDGLVERACKDEISHVDIIKETVKLARTHAEYAAKVRAEAKEEEDDRLKELAELCNELWPHVEAKGIKFTPETKATLGIAVVTLDKLGLLK